MWVKKKMSLIVMVIIMVVGQLLGDIKLTGELLIPTADGKQNAYRGIISISLTETSIQCKDKIFQRFNEFDNPKQAKIKIKTVEVERISIQGNGIIIFPKPPLYNRYRHILNHVWLLSWTKQREMMVFIFLVDIDFHKTIEKIEVLDIINEHNDPNCRACGVIKFY